MNTQKDLYPFFRTLVLVSTPENIYLLHGVISKYPEIAEKKAISKYLIQTDHENEWKNFESLLLSHIDLLGIADTLYLKQILNDHNEDPQAKETIENLIEKIKTESTSQMSDPTFIREYIYDESETIGRVQMKNTRQTSKAAGEMALHKLYGWFQTRPAERRSIISEIINLEGHIKFIAKDFCDGKTFLPDADLDAFHMVVRHFRLEAQEEH